MDGGTAAFIAIVVAVVIAVVGIQYMKRQRYKRMTPFERAEEAQKQQQHAAERELLAQEYQNGVLNPALVCPHCQTKGRVRVKDVKQKKGVSGGKATAALLTGGVSMLATGLSRKEHLTEAHCEKCNSTWHF